jgi:glycosyltransferase involved in cell wall biosynthesis
MTDLAGLRIGLLTASASRLGGGVFEAVVAQAALIRSCGGDAPVFALDDAHSLEDAARFAPGSVLHAAVSGPPMIGFAPALIDQLIAAKLDCLHLHGIWMYPSRAGAVWASRTGRPYVISPHGMLAPWITARGRGKKALARLVYERASWRRARLLHALTPSEARDIARESGRDDTWVIPNAAPPLGPSPTARPAAEFVYIGRIHPKKNLAALLAAWRRSDAVKAAGARLTIAGWGDEHDVAELRRLVAEAGESVAYVGAVYGAAKERLLSAARFVVLPSLSEGLPMAILEAWAAGVPTLMSRECNLDDGFATGAAIDCGLDAGAIAFALERALALGEAEWRGMAGAARDLAAGVYSAETVSESWAQCYRAITAGAARAGTGAAA